MTPQIRMICLLILLSLSKISAQYIDLETIPQYDCEYQKEEQFVSKGFIFVVPDVKDPILDERMEVYPSWYNDTVEIKRESELVEADYARNLWIVGKIADFKHWDLFELPIQKTENGFAFRGSEYIQRYDGISFIDSNRIAYVGNDYMSLFGIREPSYSNGMDFTITQNLRKTVFGNFIPGSDSVIQSDLRILRTRNYRYHPTEFMDFYVSLKIDSVNIQQIRQKQSDFCKAFCTFYKLDYPTEKIKAFFHHDQKEILMISGHWDRCGGTIGGLAPKGEIHTLGTSTSLISHEFGHKIYESHYGSSDNKPGYLSEGVIRYYLNREDPFQCKQDLEIAFRKMDSIDFKRKFDERTHFDFRDDYPVSGLFVDYIVKNYGIDSLNAYYAKDEFMYSVNDIFGISFNEFIDSFKVWLKNEYQSLKDA